MLETSFIIARLPPYLRSRTTRLIKSPKLFVTDSGLAAHFTSVRDFAPDADEPMRGALFETWVLQNLAGILGTHAPDAELAFWSVQGREEVDFVVSHRRKTIGIEVKAGARFKDSDLKGLRSLTAKSAAAGILAYNGSDAVSLGDNLFAVPFGLLLS